MFSDFIILGSMNSLNAEKVPCVQSSEFDKTRVFTCITYPFINLYIS